MADRWPFAPDDRPSKIVCIGSNYAHHVKEMGGKGIPAEPSLFLKPPSSLLPSGQPIRLGAGMGEVHHEVELGVIIGKRIHRVSAEQAPAAIRGWALAIDVTERTLQKRAKDTGKPWTMAKGFDTFCPISEPLPATDVDPRTATLELDVNGSPRQAGRTSDMIWPVPDLLEYISHVMTLEPGDLVLTGTPEGVGPITPGDKVEARLNERVLLTHDVKLWDD